MIEPSIIAALALAIVAIVATAIYARPRGINLFSVTAAIFIIFVIPKAALFQIYGTAIFLTAHGLISAALFNQALVVVCAFQISICVAYAVAGKSQAARSLPRSDAPAIPPWGRGLVVGLFSISMLLALAFMLYSYSITGHLFGKVAGVDRESLWYWIQKACQLPKVGLYAVAIYLIRGFHLDRNTAFDAAFLSGALLFVFALSGQRSGIFIFGLQLMVVLSLLGRLKLSHVAIAAAVFAPISLFIVLLRTATESSSSVIVNLLRRYFFEPEKIAGILRVSEPSEALGTSPWRVLATLPQHHQFLGSMDRQLGAVAFHSRSAIPPSIVGEALFYGGGISIIPVALILAVVFILIERRMIASPNPVMVVALMTVASCGYFLLLNSSIEAFLLRCIMEFAFLGAAALLVGAIDRFVSRPAIAA